MLAWNFTREMVYRLLNPTPRPFDYCSIYWSIKHLLTRRTNASTVIKVLELISSCSFNSTCPALLRSRNCLRFRFVRRAYEDLKVLLLKKGIDATKKVNTRQAFTSQVALCDRMKASVAKIVGMWSWRSPFDEVFHRINREPAQHY